MAENDRPAALPVSQKGLRAAVLRLVFPPRCAFCGRRGCEENVCPACEAQLLPVPPEQLRRLGDPRWLAHILAVWQYDGVARRALLALKYYKSRWRAA